jgi:hypothetical protein
LHRGWHYPISETRAIGGSFLPFAMLFCENACLHTLQLMRICGFGEHPLYSFIAAAKIWKVFAQQEPQKRCACPHYKHDDDVAFKAWPIMPMPVRGRDRSHKKAQAGKKGGQRTLGRCSITNSFPYQANKVGG